MTDTPVYVPPKVWTWNKENGGRFANINRPIAGATHDKELPVGKHPVPALFAGARRTGVKVTVMLEELLALGHKGAEYDAWLIKIGEGDQFGSGFVDDQSELQDPGADGPQRPQADPRVRVRLDPALPRREVRRVPADGRSGTRAEACPGCSGRWAARPISAAASAISTPMRRSRSNTPSTASRWRRSGSSTCSTGGSPRANTSRATTTRSPTWRSGPGTARWPRALLYGAGEFLSVQDYKNVQRWTDAIAAAAGGEARPHGQPRLRRSRRASCTSATTPATSRRRRRTRSRRRRRCVGRISRRRNPPLKQRGGLRCR